MHAVTLRIRVTGDGDLSYLTDTLGECARDLEVHEAEDREPYLGLVPDLEDEGRFAWEVVAESYPHFERI